MMRGNMNVKLVAVSLPDFRLPIYEKRLARKDSLWSNFHNWRLQAYFSYTLFSSLYLYLVTLLKLPTKFEDWLK